MGNYNPPYEITDKIVMLVASIAEKSGRIMEYYKVGMSGTNRERRIRAIHASLRMEGNQLSVPEIKEIVEGRPVSVSERVIREVQNLYAVYEYMQEVETYSIADFKKAHGILTKDIASESGEFRQTEKGVFNHNQFFMAPPARFIEGQMQELFAWMESQREKMHPLILSSIFHYEVLFLHPFTDGNSRLAQLWQTAILAKWRPFFSYLPLETQMERVQGGYYEAISICQMERTITGFIEFMLEQIEIALDEIKKEPKEPVESLSKYVKKLLEAMEEDIPYTANEILELLHLKSKDALRKNYLNPALESGQIQMTIPNAPKSKNQRYVKSSCEKK